jgi:hypothetical protein
MVLGQAKLLRQDAIYESMSANIPLQGGPMPGSCRTSGSPRLSSGQLDVSGSADDAGFNGIQVMRRGCPYQEMLILLVRKRYSLEAV